MKSERKKEDPAIIAYNERKKAAKKKTKSKFTPTTFSGIGRPYN